jgi:NitT/TauT family transport system substrate-binding protein
LVPSFSVITKRRPTRRAALAAVGAALLAPARPLGAQSALILVVGATATDDTTPILYGQQVGLFRRAGLTIDLQKVPSGAASLAAVLGGTLQIGGTNVLSIIQAHLKNVPLEILAPGGLYAGTTEFVAAVVKTSAAYARGRDLNGKVIGVASIGDLNAIAFLSWMDQDGGDAKSVKQVEVPYPLVAAALDEGRIEAGTLIQPILSQAVASGKARIFANTYRAIAPRFVFTAWTTTASWAAANADAARRFARTMREAETYCNTHRAETAPLLAAFSGVDVQQVLRGGRDTFAAAFPDPKDLQPLIDSAAKYGTIERRFDALELISPAVRGMTA